MSASTLAARVAASRLGSHLAARALRRPAVRRLLWGIVDRSAGARFREQADAVPRQVMADQVQMLRNLLRAVERWIAEGGAGDRTVARFLQSFPFDGARPDAEAAKRRFLESFGRLPPGFVTISPTKRCNLACSGCYASSHASESDSLPYEVVDRVVGEQRRLWGSRFTVISGGEPFLYRSDGRGILDLAAAHPETFFLVYTNGTLITDEVARRIAELGNLTPAVSIEGFELETDARRGKGTYARIMRAMRSLREAGVLYGVSVTATRSNADLVLSPDFVHAMFTDAGAYYMWIFQYMPIGRGQNLDTMVTTEQRLAMLERTRRWMYDEGLMIADFWNSATISSGCISAGAPGGYIYIDWNGNIMPCVFNPYTVDNILSIYREGGDLNRAISSPLMHRIREWQSRYFAGDGDGRIGNLFAPCPIRDHHRQLRAILDATGARPADAAAEAALRDEGYYQGLCRYGEELQRASQPLWEKEMRGEAPQQAAEQKVSVR